MAMRFRMRPAWTACTASISTILAGDKPVGTIGSTSGQNGLALVRTDRVVDALDAGLPLTAGGLGIRLAEPDVVRAAPKQTVA